MFGLAKTGRIGWLERVTENRKGVAPARADFEFHTLVRMSGGIHDPPVDLDMDGDLDIVALDIRMGATDRGKQMLEELLRVNPDHVAARYAYAQLLMREGREEEARRQFELHRQALERANGSESD